jgi:hypothetical protein
MNTKYKPTTLQTAFTIIAFVVLCTCAGMATGAFMNALDKHYPSKMSSPKPSKAGSTALQKLAA